MELAKTCPVCLHALEDFNTVYAGTPLSDALVKYGNSTLNLLRVVNTTLSSRREPGSAGLSALASNASHWRAMRVYFSVLQGFHLGEAGSGCHVYKPDTGASMWTCFASDLASFLQHVADEQSD